MNKDIREKNKGYVQGDTAVRWLEVRALGSVPLDRLFTFPSLSPHHKMGVVSASTLERFCNKMALV